MEPSLLADTMGQWKTFWTFPAIMALVIVVVFTLAFWDRTDVSGEDE